MHFLYGGMGLIGFVLWLYYVVDAIRADEAECRILPKAVWVCVVLLIPGIGSLLWVLGGRPRQSVRSGARRNGGGPGRPAHRGRPAPSVPRDRRRRGGVPAPVPRTRRGAAARGPAAPRGRGPGMTALVSVRPFTERPRRRPAAG
ncbi:PLD nuclease N-terminal domain-containing protein [Allosalinactinospora lopnorensis]|uniref:PLD nuclease N-terminal domain-containing protein n=1 Tax=Allosalinactinospora lopnorensis TaxID=1352348 RepID=UPI000696FED1|nr:PLD nuclease N-terminal domain-containing protein [Allosalinactinospora lopnorensis]